MARQLPKVQYSDPDLLYVNNNNNRYVVPREDTELKSAGLNLGYQIDRRWQLNGTYGWEWNDYQTYNDADTGGQAWQLRRALDTLTAYHSEYRDGRSFFWQDAESEYFPYATSAVYLPPPTTRR